jgi:hypothetical protein
MKLPDEGFLKMSSNVARNAPSPEMERLLALGREAVEKSRGRLIFALDATMSRQPMWDMACTLQGKMFDAVGGSLSVQLIYFRGLDECKASRWANSSRELMATMTMIRCRAGHTQIEKVLRHARKEATTGPVKAMIFVGDACEESIDQLAPPATELGQAQVPVFLFQEGNDARTERAFREIARLSGGVWAPFDAGSAKRLGELMRVAAQFSAGNTKAIEELKKIALLR